MGSFSASIQVFVEQLQAQGYALASVKLSTRLVKDFAAWLDVRGVDGQSLSATHVVDYLDGRWLHRHHRRGDAYTLHAFAQLVAPEGYRASTTDAVGDDPSGETMGAPAMTTPSFATLLQGFFTCRLMQQRQASPHTIGSYRDSFRLLLQFAQQRFGFAPQKMTLEQVDAPLITAFLDDLQTNRGISAASRNVRLTAIRSLFRYASFEMPTHAAQIQRVLAIPNKRCTRTQIRFLVREEIHALLGAPDRLTRSGRRDHALLLLAAQSGLRLSEITGLCRNAICLGTGAHVRVVGKGRKERSTPLTKATADPAARVCLLSRAIDDRSRTVYQQCAQIAVAALAHAQPV